MERPAPPITVTIPGRGPAPSELLAVGPPPARRAPRSRREHRDRLVGGAGAAVLLAGLLAAGTQDPPAPAEPPAPALRPAGAPVRGVQAAVEPGRLPAAGSLAEALVLVVSTAPAGGRGDSGSPGVDDEVTLLGVSARGFVLTVVGLGLPQPVPVDRLGTSLLLDLEVRVVDCSVDTQAPRAVTVEVRRGAGEPVQLRASSGASVVRALDGLVSRTCRRPRG